MLNTTQTAHPNAQSAKLSIQVSKPIPVERIDKYWELLFPFVHWLDKSGLPRSAVLASLKSQEYFLHICYEQDICVGCLIVSPYPKLLYVIVAQTFDCHLQSLYNAVNDIEPLLEQYNVRTVSFTTHRLGWRRIAEQIGYAEVKPMYYKRDYL